VPPEAIVTRVPKELSAIIQRMMAKEASERFANMGEVIRTLEQWLGVHHAGTFSPRDEQIDQIERFVKNFNGAPAAVLRGRLVAGAASVCLLAAVLLMFFGRLGGAFGLAGMVLHAAAAYFIANGLTRKTYLFRRARQFALGLSVGDCVVAAAGAGLFAVLLWVLGLFWLWTGFGLAGVGLALALRFGLDRRIEAERRESLDGCERLLRRMRLSGVDEEDLRQFVAKYAGRDWEEFYEALFGYEAKLSARAVLLRGGSAGVREKFAGWREPAIALIDRVEKARRESRERRLLEQVEQARLVAAGLTERAARDRAAEAAADLMKQAKAIRHADVKRRTVGPAAVTAIGMPNLGHLAQTAAQPNPFDFGHSPRRERAEGIVGLFVGPHVRAVLAAVLLAGCGLWVYQSGLLVNFYLATRTTHAAGATFQPVSLRPLELDGLPASWTAWCDGVNVGWGGVLLLASLFFRGNRSALLVLLGTAITVLGHRFGIRTVEPIQEHHVSLLLGTVLALVGYRLGRRV
jgi:hypothetical protein